MRLSFALLLGLFAISYSYILDSSCAQYSDMIIAGMKSAFDRAQAAYDIFDNPNGGDEPDAIAQQDLMQYLFLDALLGSPDKWDTIKARYKSVLKFNVNNGNPEPTPSTRIYRFLSVDKLIFFCDYTRFDLHVDPAEDKDCKGTLRPGWTCDNLMQANIKLDDEVFIYCLDPTDDKTYMAWTMPPSATRPPVIQICPPYLEEIKNSKYRTLGDLGSGGMLAVSQEALAGKLGPVKISRSPMNIIMLFDSILLHEMTHAISTPPGTIDVGGYSGAYGWEQCVQISRQNIINNADSYAFFGLGARMISPNVQGVTAQRPMEDGTIQILPANTVTKRDAIGHNNPIRPRDLNITLFDNTTIIPKASDAAGVVVSASASKRNSSSSNSGHSVSGHASVSSNTSISAHSTFSTLTSIRHQNYSSSLLSLSTKTSTQSLLESRSGSSLSSGSKLPSKSSAGSSLSAFSSSSASASNARNSGPVSLSRASMNSSSATDSMPATSLFNGTAIAAGLLPSKSSKSLSSGSLSSSSSSQASISTKPGIKTTVTSGGSIHIETLPPSTITPPPSASTAALAVLFINWATVTPTTTSGISSATHDSHGWPIIPCLNCWFCPPCGGGRGGGIGFVIPNIDIKGPGIIPPPTGINPPPGFSTDMPPITLDSAGNPTYESTEPTKQSSTAASSTNAKSSPGSSTSSSRSSSTCSARITSSCDTLSTILMLSGASIESTSIITLSCSTVTACSTSLTRSSTTNTQVPTATIIGDDFGGMSWFDTQQSILAAIIADTTDARVTWSRDEASVTGSSTRSSNTASSTGSSIWSSSETASTRSSTSSIGQSRTNSTISSSSAPNVSPRTSSASAMITQAPICSEGNNTAMGMNNEPASWCFCAGRGPFSTINKATQNYCAFTALPTQTISLTSHSTSVNTACAVTSLTNTLGPTPTLATYCTCGNEMVAIQTTSNTAGTTFIACGTTTTFSTITPTLNPTPTQTVSCYPKRGGNPITNEDELVGIIKPNVRSFCNGTVSNWLQQGGDPQTPAGNNYVTSGYTTDADAPADCQHFYKGDLTPLQVDLCALPLQSIMNDCPYNGGYVDTVCGKSWLYTCVLGTTCAPH